MLVNGDCTHPTTTQAVHLNEWAAHRTKQEEIDNGHKWQPHRNYTGMAQNCLSHCTDGTVNGNLF